MKLKSAAMVLVLSCLAVAASAETTFATRAYVVSVDAKAKSITLKHTGSDSKTWKQSVVSWDDSTTWKRADTHIWEKTPATVDLAKALKKDDKVYVSITDRDGTQLRLESLCTIPASETVG